MSDAPAGTSTLERWVKIGGSLMALVSTTLAVFIALKTQLISSAVDETKNTLQRTLQETDLSLKHKQLEEKVLELKTKNMHESSRLVVQWPVITAGAFATRLADSSTAFRWIDTTLETQVAALSPKWLERGGLMEQARDNGLLLRQIVCLRIINIGNSPALNLVIEASYRDFSPRAFGEDGPPYTEMQAADTTLTRYPLGDLTETAQKTHQLTTELLIPLAHAVGNDRYVGRVLIPQRLTWVDHLQGEERSHILNRRDGELAAYLTGSNVGRVRGK